MTRDAVRTTYQEFLDQLTDEMLDVVEAEFGGGLLGKAAKTGAKRVTKNIQSEMRTQGEIVVDYAAALAFDAGDQSRYERRFLETNPLYKRYDGADADALESDLRTHFRAVGDDLAPLVASSTDDFWLALREEYSRAAADRVVERNFSQADTFRKYQDGVFPSQTLADRVITVIDEAEQRLRADIESKLDEIYDE